MTTRWKVWLAAFGLFACGLAVGCVLTVGVGRRALRRALQAPDAFVTPVERATQRIHAELTEELHLTPEQAALVRTELERTGGDLRRLRVDTVAQMRRTVEQAAQRIGHGLTPAQRADFEALVRERFARFGWTYPPTDDGRPAPGR